MDSILSGPLAFALSFVRSGCPGCLPTPALLHGLGDTMAVLAYGALALVAARHLARVPKASSRRLLHLAVVAFLLLSLVHGLLLADWPPALEAVRGGLKVLAMGLLFGTMFLAGPQIVHMLADQADEALRQSNAELRAEVARRTAAEEQLHEVQRRLEGRVAEATKALGAAYDRLQASRQRLAFALEGANDGLWDWQIDKGSIYFSPRWAQMLGHGERAMDTTLDKRFAMIHPKDRAAANAAFDAHMAGRVPLYESEHRVWTKQGDYIWILDRGKVVERNSDGAALRVVGTSTDITRRKRAELALQASNARVKRLYEHTPAMLHSVDGEGRLISVTNYWLEIMGYARDEVIGRLSTDFMTEESRRYLHETALPAFRRDGTISDVPCRLRRKDGSCFDVLLSSTSERNRAGRIVRSLTVVVDVSLRNQALRQLQESEARLRLALEGAKEGLWDWHVDRAELYLNPRAAAILGYEPDHLPTDIHFWQDLLPEEDKEGFARDLADLASGRIVSMLCEQQIRRIDGRIIWIDWRVSHVPPENNQGSGRIVGVFSDITDRKEAELATAYRAMHDGLTGLPNRMAYEDQLARARHDAEAGHHQLAVMFLDLDRFKDVNDSFGHDCGDRLLADVAKRLQRCVRNADLVARFGGDEFALLAMDYKGLREINRLARRIIDAIGEPFAIDGHVIEIGVSIGIALFPDDPSPADLLLAHADLALYCAKRAGRGTWRRYHPSMPTRRQIKPTDDRDLEAALRNGQFELCYQPIVNVDDLKVSAIEAIMRWNHPRRGQLASQVFFPEIESSPMLRDLLEWALQTAAEHYVAWQAQGLALGAMLAIDLPTAVLRTENVCALLEPPLCRARMAPEHLVVELTENALSEEAGPAAALNQLAALGVRIAIADFGVGYSSLTRLKSLPIDQLKIDRSFTANMIRHSQDAAVIESIVGIADSLGMDSVAEGVDTSGQLSAVAMLGCGRAQGALFSPAIAAFDLSRWLGVWHERCNHDRDLDLLRRGS